MAFQTRSTNEVIKYPSTPIRFEQAGQQATGHLVEAATLTKDGDSFKKYTLRTSNGVYISTLGSHQLDRGLEGVPMGSLVRVTYGGKKKIKGGKSVNEFKVEVDTEDSIDVASLPVSANSAEMSL